MALDNENDDDDKKPEGGEMDDAQELGSLEFVIIWDRVLDLLNSRGGLILNGLMLDFLFCSGERVEGLGDWCLVGVRVTDTLYGFMSDLFFLFCSGERVGGLGDWCLVGVRVTEC